MPGSIEQRLRQALAATHDRAPRPMARLELPLAADRWLTRTLINSLRPAAVLAPILRRPQGLSLLLTRRAEHLSSHQGQISFPGGRRDPEDASAAANALREAQEEVGLDPARVEVLGYLDDYPTISRYLVTPVIGLVDGPVEWVADPGEVAEVFEVPLEVLLDPRSYRRKSLSRDGLVVPYYEVHWSGYRIWGATAGMLWDLCGKVNALG
ncbi:MAG: CoA pyrophosphatase [Panacagrimonas sp.]